METHNSACCGPFEELPNFLNTGTSSSLVKTIHGTGAALHGKLKMFLAQCFLLSWPLDFKVFVLYCGILKGVFEGLASMKLQEFYWAQ
jgi:hypothetical protein